MARRQGEAQFIGEEYQEPAGDEATSRGAPAQEAAQSPAGSWYVCIPCQPHAKVSKLEGGGFRVEILPQRGVQDQLATEWRNAGEPSAAYTLACGIKNSVFEIVVKPWDEGFEDMVQRDKDGKLKRTGWDIAKEMDGTLWNVTRLESGYDYSEKLE